LLHCTAWLRRAWHCIGRRNRRPAIEKTVQYVVCVLRGGATFLWTKSNNTDIDTLHNGSKKISFFRTGRYDGK
jgi:hypothetical protein